MCGIAGILSGNGRRVEPRHLLALADSLRHRGPDDEGYVLMDAVGTRFEGFRGRDTVVERRTGLRPITDAPEGRYSLGLVHRRLSIIDVSAAGHQPMTTADGMLSLTYNGEIYNYVELRRELEALGHCFESASDTEVVLHAYQQWGEECLAKFNGMWALALADRRRRRLFCARDRLGVKPFYYWFDGQTFAFASEIKALVQLPFIEVVPNERMVWDFLVLGALDHTEETFYDHIGALGAGQYLTVSFEGHLTRRTYWELHVDDDHALANRPLSRRDIADVRELIVDAVRLRLRSDVSVGFCLSGGLDSSSIVCVADRLLVENTRPQIGTELKVFHAAFDDKPIDEREYVQAVLERCRVSPFYVMPTDAEFIDDYAQLLWHQEQPFGGPSVYAQYRVVQLASQSGVKVLLDGQGADELFGGYYQYAGANLVNMLAAGNCKQAWAVLCTNGWVAGRHALLQTSLRRLPVALAETVLMELNSDASLIDSDFLAAHAERGDVALQDSRASVPLGHMLVRDLTRHSLPRLLRYEDRNSMAFSLESRVPFADDPRLIEFVCGLPDSAKQWNGWSKYALRTAMTGLVPDKVLWRRAKLGFSVPQQRWANAAQNSALADVLRTATSRFVNRAATENWVRALGTGRRRTDTAMLWRLLELGMWEASLAHMKRSGSTQREAVVREL
jgi:asparagine synthase (glutamine-hydrolysing)